MLRVASVRRSVINKLDMVNRVQRDFNSIAVEITNLSFSTWRCIRVLSLRFWFGVLLTTENAIRLGGPFEEEVRRAVWDLDIVHLLILRPQQIIEVLVVEWIL